MREKSLPFFYCFVVILHHKEGVDLIPANIELSAIEVSLVNAMSRELILKSMVEKLRDFYDFIIEYYGAAEPPVRCGESHLSGLTEPLRSL